MAKSEKIFEVLKFIGECPDLTPRDLAQLCDVSERAIYRYINTLIKVGISVKFQDGGYKLQGYYGEIFREVDAKGLEALKSLLMAGMQIYNDKQTLEYGRNFIKVIDMNLPKQEMRRFGEIEVVPEAVRATNRGGTIIVGHSSQPDRTINPILTSETISVNLMDLIFSGLVKFDNLRQPVPDLARSWEISEDGKVWTFHIRDDVVFHDGYPLTAHDVEFTYRSILDPQNESPRRNRYEIVDKIEVEADYVFKMTLKYPFAPFICVLGRAIAPKHLLENTDIRKNPFNERPIGSGPFRLVDWTDDDTIILDANREYFRKDRPILDRLIFKSYLDRKAALQAIARGEMDIALGISASDLLFVGKNRSFRIYPTAAPDYYAIILNLKDQIFRDIRVRKAIDHAVDKDLIIQNQLKGHGEKCTGPFVYNSWAHNPNVTPAYYSIKRARELLKQAGWTDVNEDGILEKDGKAFEISIAVSNISDTLERVATSVKAQLMKVGIKANLEYVSDKELYKTSFQAIALVINTGDDPEFTRRTWHSKSGSTNLSSYNNRFVDELIDIGIQERDMEKRKITYQKIHELIHDDCPAIFLASAFDYIGSNYRFRTERFPSMLYFLTTMKDWQIVGSEADGRAHDQKQSIRVMGN